MSDTRITAAARAIAAFDGDACFDRVGTDDECDSDGEDCAWYRGAAAAALRAAGVPA